QPRQHCHLFLSPTRPPPPPTLFPYTTLFRSGQKSPMRKATAQTRRPSHFSLTVSRPGSFLAIFLASRSCRNSVRLATESVSPWSDRKSTRLNSSHVKISYAVFCLKKKKEDTD